MGIAQKLIVNTTFLFTFFLIAFTPTTFNINYSNTDLEDPPNKKGKTPVISMEEVLNFAPGDTVIAYYGDGAENQFWNIVYHPTEDAYFAVGERQEVNSALATLTRINPCGYVEWTRTYFSDVTLAAYVDIEVMDDGNLLVMGRKFEGNGFNEMEKVLSKLDAANGNIIWSKTFEAPVRLAAGNLVKATGDPAGEVYYMTHWYSVVGTTDDMAFTKLDNDGNIIWQRLYDHNNGDDELAYTLPLPGGHLVNFGLASAARDGFVFTMDENGVVLDGKIFSVPNTDLTHFRSAQQLANGGYVINGYITENNGDKHHLIVGLDANLDPLFSRVHFTSYDVDAGHTARDAAGNIYLMRYLQVGGDNRLAVMRYNSAGAFNWMRYFDVNTTANISAGFRGIKARPDTDQLIFTDIGQPAGGFGGNDCFLAVTDTEVSSCITESFSPVYSAVTIPSSDFPVTFSAVSLTSNDLTATDEIDYSHLSACDPFPIEVCDNGIDDDCDGLVDCNDPDLQDSCCCIGPIELDLGMDTLICGTAPFELNAGGGFITYEWQDGSSDSTFSVIASGDYSVTVSNGCETVSDTISVALIPPPMETSDEISICFGDTAIVLGNIVTTTDTFVQVLTTPEGCDSTHTIFVSVSEDIVLSASIMASCEDQGNGSISVSTSGGMPPYQYVWDLAGETSSTISDIFAGDYTITITDQMGCTAQRTYTMTEIPAPTWEVASEGTSCGGGADGVITIQDTTGSLVNYALDDGAFQSSPFFGNLTAGIYEVFVEDTFGCVYSQMIEIEEPFDWEIQLPPDTTINYGETFKIGGQINTVGNFTFEWAPSTDLSCDDCLDPSASPLETTRYTLTAIDEFNCLDTASITISVNITCDEEQLGIPNAFTPNSDGTNDFFGIMNTEGAEEIIRIQIFDRWGALIFEGASRDDRWDGTYNGKDMASGVYVYMIEYVCPDGTSNIASGDLTLIR